MLKVNLDNYFDIAEAIHCWLTLNHDGQFSTTYELLSKSQFNPGPLWTETRCMEENPYYSEINRDNVEELMNGVNYFLDVL